jgi:hypothetical protein
MGTHLLPYFGRHQVLSIGASYTTTRLTPVINTRSEAQVLCTTLPTQYNGADGTVGVRGIVNRTFTDCTLDRTIP